MLGEIGKLLVLVGLLGGLALGLQGSPPELLFVDFPETIAADGQPVTGFLLFQDPDGDVVKAQFELLEGEREALTIEPDWEFDPGVKGETEGAIEFRIAAAAPGAFKLRATLRDGAGLTSEPVEFAFTAEAVSAPAPVLAVSPERLEFRGREGEALAPQTLTIANAGGGVLEWVARSDQPWLLVGATRGTVPAGGRVELQIIAQTGGLAAGTYEGTVTITAEGAEGSPARVPVTLVLEPKPRPPVLDVSPTSLSFRGEVGAALPSRTITVRNAGGGVLSWRASTTTPWLSLSPTSGQLEGGRRATITVRVSTQGLNPGSYQGRITIVAEGAENSPQTVAVTLQLTAPTERCGSTIFFDDFSDRNSGWVVGDFQGASWGYTQDGQYRVLTKWSNTIAWSWAPLPRVSGSFCLEVDVKHLVQGALSDFGMLGVIFAGNPDARTFAFFGILNPLGAYVVGRLSGQVRFLQGPIVSEAIQGVNRTEKLLIIARGNRAEFYINGKRVTTLSLSTAGAVGVFVATFDDPNVNGRFDNFRVREFR